MEEPFSLHATLDAVGQAMAGILCHMFFISALHGLGLSLALALVGASLRVKGHRFGVPLLAVARRFSILCLIVMLPGVISLLTTGKLPPAGVFNVNSIGFIVFWGMVLTHMIGEEMNHEWFAAKKREKQSKQEAAPPVQTTSSQTATAQTATAVSNPSQQDSHQPPIQKISV